MPLTPRLPRMLAFAAAISACGVAPLSQAAIANADPTPLFELGAQKTPATSLARECETMSHQLSDLDAAIERLPEVRHVRDAFARSTWGARQQAVSRALHTENCFANDPSADLSNTCLELIAELDACAVAFESSDGFKRLQTLPEVVEFERISERYSDFCSDVMPADSMQDGCDAYCDDEEPCEDADQDDAADLPTTA